MEPANNPQHQPQYHHTQSVLLATFSRVQKAIMEANGAQWTDGSNSQESQQRPGEGSSVNWSNPAIDSGGFGEIVLLANGRVRKSPLREADPNTKECMFRSLKREHLVYTRLPDSHKRLTQMIEFNEQGLTLEYMPNGALDFYLFKHESTSILQRVKWAIQATEAVQLLHSHNIIHCDIKPGNFVLDADLEVRIIDFGGSIVNGKRQQVREHPNFYMPRKANVPSSRVSDLFALGSTIYFILTGIIPYESVPESLVTWNFRKRRFPKLDHVPCGEIIRKCWLAKYNSAVYLLVDLQAELIKMLEAARAVK